MLLMAYVDLHNSKREEVWLLDSDCSNHMCGNKQWFLALDETFRQVVKLGNNMKMEVMGSGGERAVGCIKLHVNGTTQALAKCFIILELKNNWLSIGQLQEKDLIILIQHGECKIYHYID